jgi:hypothetical protein
MTVSMYKPIGGGTVLYDVDWYLEESVNRLNTGSSFLLNSTK